MRRKAESLGGCFSPQESSELLNNREQRVSERMKKMKKQMEINKKKPKMTQRRSKLLSYQVLQRGNRFSSLPALTYHSLVFNEV